MSPLVFQAINVEYTEHPNIRISLDGQLVRQHNLPLHETFKSSRITLPVDAVGFLPHVEFTDTRILQNHSFESIPLSSFSEQQLFHYYEVGYRTSDSSNFLTPKIYLDGDEQDQSFNIFLSGTQKVDTFRIYFDALSYGYIPHIHNTASASHDAEILWAKPVALPPRFYRGIRTHSEFQVTYKGDVDLQWYLDGEVHGSPYYLDTVTTTTTKKQYFPSGTVGHVLQYKHMNPEAGGKVYMVETDITLADIEQQALTPQVEG